MSKPLRVLYAAGPGNVIGTYRYWCQGQDDPSQFAVTYSAQFYSICCELDAQGYLIASYPQKEFLRDGRFILEHRPIPFRDASGVLYHWGQLWYGLGIIVSALRFRADLVIVVEGSTHLFLMSVLPWLGIRVVPLLQCVLWQKHATLSPLQQLVLRLSRHLFARACTATIVVSEEITAQVKQITGGQAQPILRIFPVYRREQLSEIPAPEPKRSPFRVLFVGRIEAEKGVFDLLAVAERLIVQAQQEIQFVLCGEGSALADLRQAADQAGLGTALKCLGHCQAQQLQQMYAWAHVVIVPTRSEFVEGFNKVVVESILVGRPAIASTVCTDLSFFRGAVLAVPPNDLEGYAQAILKLRDDRAFYDQMCQKGLQVRDRLCDPPQSWGKALKSLLLAVRKSDNALGES